MSLSIIGSESAYWIDPSGKKYELNSLTHGEWARNTLGKSSFELLKDGWVKVRMNPQGFPCLSIHVDSTNNIYDFIDELVYQNPVYLIVVETHDKNYSISYPEFVDSGKSLKSFIESKKSIELNNSLKGEHMNNNFIKELIKEADFFFKKKEEDNPIGFESSPAIKKKDTGTVNESTVMQVKDVKSLPDDLRGLISDIVTLQKAWAEIKAKKKGYEEAQLFIQDKINEFLNKTYLSILDLNSMAKDKDIIEFKKQLGDVLNKKQFEKYNIEKEEIEKALSKVNELNSKIEKQFNDKVFNLYNKLEKDVIYVDQVLRATLSNTNEVTYFIGKMTKITKPEQYEVYRSSVESALNKIVQEIPSLKEIVAKIRKYIDEILVTSTVTDEKFHKLVKIFETGKINDYIYILFNEKVKQILSDPDTLKVITEIKFKEKYPDKDLKSEIEKRLQKIKQDNPKISDEEAKQQIIKELADELDIHIRPSVYEKKSKELFLSQYMNDTKRLFKNILLSKNPELAKDEKKLEDEVNKLVEEYFRNSKEIEDILIDIEKIPAPYIEELEELNKLKKRLSSIKNAFLYDHKKIELISKLLQSNYDFDTAIDLIAEVSDIYIPELEELSKSLSDLISKIELVASELDALQKGISNIEEACKELENIDVEEVKTEPSMLEKMREALTPGQEVVPVPASLKNKIDIK
jgi:hypothetical protein